MVTLLSRIITDVAEQASLPGQVNLLSNYPNPFNPTTTISYELPRSSDVVLTVYDVLGNQVNQRVKHGQLPGRYNIVFDGTQLTSGVYFVHLQALGTTRTRKMILLR